MVNDQQAKPTATLFNEKTHELVSEKELQQQFVQHVNEPEPEPIREKVLMTILRGEFYNLGKLDVETNYFFITNNDETFRTPDSRFATRDSQEIIWNSLCECYMQTEVKFMLIRKGKEQPTEGLHRLRKDGTLVIGYMNKFLEHMGENVIAITTEYLDPIGNLYVNVEPLKNKSDGWVASLDECMNGLETIRNRLIGRYENFLREEHEEWERHLNGEDVCTDEDDYLFECDGSVRPMRIPSAQLPLEPAMEAAPTPPQLMQNIFRELNECVSNGVAKTNGNCDKNDS